MVIPKLYLYATDGDECQDVEENDDDIFDQSYSMYATSFTVLM